MKKAMKRRENPPNVNTGSLKKGYKGAKHIPLSSIVDSTMCHGGSFPLLHDFSLITGG